VARDLLLRAACARSPVARVVDGKRRVADRSAGPGEGLVVGL
ncbi:MAG: hypothetical protein AVDCRST_MAG17-1143, partial [uncultured Solirubrobacterales bacterium]